MLQKIQETAAFLKSKMRTSPETAIILGTGLGSLVNEITEKYEIEYKDIPNFPLSTVEGHSGKLIFGKLGGKEIMAMQGRFHFYEGYSMKEVTFPVRVMRELGIKTLFCSLHHQAFSLEFPLHINIIFPDLTDIIIFFGIISRSAAVFQQFSADTAGGHVVEGCLCGFCQFQHIYCSEYTGPHGLYRIMLIMNR